MYETGKVYGYKDNKAKETGFQSSLVTYFYIISKVIIDFDDNVMNFSNKN